MRVAVALTGYKGWYTLKHLLQERVSLAQVFTHKRHDAESGYQEDIERLCGEHNLPCQIAQSISVEEQEAYDVIFFVGWQYLFPPSKQAVILHDSLLPKYRGFSPTATALIKGEEKIGVSAFLPSDTVDAGPVLGYEAVIVSYPMKLREALRMQALASSKLIADIISSMRASPGDLRERAIKQDEANATYSVWRTPDDHQISWDASAEYIARFIDAVGWPYSGAVAYLEGVKVIIEDAQIVGDKVFELRDHGKIWEIADNCPTVICGAGMLQIQSARFESGERVVFKRLKTRFTTDLREGL